MYGTGFAVFCINKQNIIISCEMTNKMARNERMSPVKQIYIFQGKFGLQFLV